MSEEQTKQIVRRHLQAWAKGDVEGLMADYAEDAVLLNKAAGVLRGKQAIAAMFRQVFAEAFPPAELKAEFEPEIVAGDAALVHWSARTNTLRTSGGFDTFVVRDGKIVMQAGGADIHPVSGG